MPKTHLEPLRKGCDVKTDRPALIKFKATSILLSVVLGLLAFFVLNQIAQRAMPKQSGAVRYGPELAGVYRCCGSGGKNTSSWVGEHEVSCGSLSFYSFLTASHTDCGMRERLDGRWVTAKQVFIPTSNGDVLRVVSMSDETEAVLDLRTTDIVRRWRSNSVVDSLTAAFLLAIVVHTAAFLYLTHRK